MMQAQPPQPQQQQPVSIKIVGTGMILLGFVIFLAGVIIFPVSILVTFLVLVQLGTGEGFSLDVTADNSSSLMEGLIQISFVIIPIIIGGVYVRYGKSIMKCAIPLQRLEKSGYQEGVKSLLILLTATSVVFLTLWWGFEFGFIPTKIFGVIFLVILFLIILLFFNRNKFIHYQ